MQKVKRVLLKVSGESLSGPGKTGFSPEDLNYTAGEIARAREENPTVECAVMLGGGNLIRGSRLIRDLGLTPVVADISGMLATLQNALVLQDVLEKHFGLEVRVATALHCHPAAEPFLRRPVIKHMSRGRVVILAGGSGQPRFTTDSGAVLKGVELEAELVLKATKVDGIYDRDPKLGKGPKARLIASITHREMIRRRLKIMDRTAVTLAEENQMPIAVFNFFEAGNLSRVLGGARVGSLISTT